MRKNTEPRADSSAVKRQIDAYTNRFYEAWGPPRYSVLMGTPWREEKNCGHLHLTKEESAACAVALGLGPNTNNRWPEKSHAMPEGDGWMVRETRRGKGGNVIELEDYQREQGVFI